MNLGQIEDYLNRFLKERKPKDQELKERRFTLFMALLGNPHLKYGAVHVGGTSGKGSVASFLSLILTHSGLKTGLNLSPHVEKVTERIELNNHPLSPEKFSCYLKEIEEKINFVSEKLSPLSYFEVLTGLALYVFEKEKVDLAVIEVGIGGKRDVTNIILPEVVILTNVDLDHTEILGETIEEIAQDKIGIVKKGVPVLTAARQGSVKKIIRKKTQELGCNLFFLGEKIKTKIINLDESGAVFDLETPWGKLQSLRIKLLGRHQVENAALALSAALILKEKGFKVTPVGIRKGLKNTNLAARLEIVSHKPLVILDGAHNQAKIKVAIGSIREIFPDKNLVIIFLPRKGKDNLSIFSEIAPNARKIILTQLKDVPIPNLLAESEKILREKYKIQVQVVLDSQLALHQALQETTEKDCLLITGSFYLIGEIRSLFRK